jgi:hypothetical protein
MSSDRVSHLGGTRIFARPKKPLANRVSQHLVCNMNVRAATEGRRTAELREMANIIRV